MGTKVVAYKPKFKPGIDELIPREVLEAWRFQLERPDTTNVPPEVKQFIEALAAKLEDFGRIGEHEEHVDGRDLLLCMKEFNGEAIDPDALYPIKIPHLVALDHNAAMHRSFHKRGKQGLVDYCKARVKGTELERLLTVLNVQVFKQESEQFKTILNDISHAPKVMIQQ